MTAPDSTPTVREAGDEGIAAVLTEADLSDLADIISPGGNTSVNPNGFSADLLRQIIGRHVASLAPLVAERERAAYLQGYEFALRHLHDEPVQADLAKIRAALAPETPGDAT